MDMPLDQRLSSISQDAGLDIIDSVRLPGHAARLSPVPSILEPAVHAHLCNLYPNGLYTHQSAAIKSSMEGNDICLTTPTASGKSLVFLSISADLLKRRAESCVLALYPAKALIQDQLTKWRELLTPLGYEPGYIDGGVPTSERPGILDRHKVVLMTPDVTHAWLMSHLQTTEVRRFLSRLSLLILDEAHVYDGVFGTNMAYFLRRLQAVTGNFRLISSTATVGEPKDFIGNLTGRPSVVFSAEDDGSFIPEKTILLARNSSGNSFDQLVDLLVRVAHSDIGRFLAFADSRKMVEQIVSTIARREHQNPAADEDEAEDLDTARLNVLPYRAGYEEHDRQAIQASLADGRLAGVVSTSALELGLDIGEINVALLLGTPPSVKSFWQRVGRTGRRNPGVCLIIDDRSAILSQDGLRGFMQRSPERGSLYLENRFLQYLNALCAAVEANDMGEHYSRQAFATVPDQFMKFLENEIQPVERIPDDLYSLKQRSQAGAHIVFPLRTGIEIIFEVLDQNPAVGRLGTLTLSQALREAYPGAVYHYMAKPYRVQGINFSSAKIHVCRERRYTTKPLLQSMVFPKFQGETFRLLSNEEAFLAETELQVNERVIGLHERRGHNVIKHVYGTGSKYSQRPLTRFFQTTGVCWYLPDLPGPISEQIARQILDAFCLCCGVETRDLGVGIFHASRSPVAQGQVHGQCIYDATDGSLRLTQQLMDRFREILSFAGDMITERNDYNETLYEAIDEFYEITSDFHVPDVDPPGTAVPSEGDWVTIIAPGEAGMLVGRNCPREVVIIKHLYTPQGLMYELVSDAPQVQWMVSASTVVPIHGRTRLIRLNLMTNEIQDML